MSETWHTKNLGPVSAYAVAKRNGWTGTEAEWEALQAAAPQKASDAEAYAAGTRSGTPVGNTDPAYHNNAEYYKGQAANEWKNAKAFADGTRDGEPVTSDDPAYRDNAVYFKDLAADEAEDAEAWANGTRGGVPVTSGDPAYEKNGPYWEGQAKLQKEAAQAAAETASAAYNVNLLAPNYDATATYNVGDHVIYSGGYYRCISAITTAEAWTAAHWTQDTVGAETSSLKSAITQITGNEQIQFTDPSQKQYINTSGTSTDYTVVTAQSTAYSYAIVDCSEGDQFTIFGAGGTNGRLWAFVKSNGDIIDPRAESVESGNNLVITAPADANKLVLNFVGDGIAYKNNLIVNRVDNLESGSVETKNEIKSGFIYGPNSVVSGNMLPFATDWVDGKYYANDGNQHLVTTDSANYAGFILPVEKNTEYVCTFYRFVILLSDDKYTVIGSTLENATRFNSGIASYVAVSFNKTTYPISSYVISKGTLDSDPYKIYLPWLYEDKQLSKIIPNGLYAEESNPSANSSIIIIDTSNNVKYNKKIVYEAHFTGTIGNITIYHGSGTYGSYVRITPTNIIVNTSGSDIYNDAHNITIADYLYVMIDTDDQNGVKVSVMSNGKRVEITASGWNGWQGQVFALTASALIYHRITWTCSDLNCPIWLFGDSYLSKTSTERYGYYLHQWGYDKFLACGYPGAGSANVYSTLTEMLKITQPKYLIWAMGMNDPDTDSAINATWKTYAGIVLTTCKALNITPIFSKIPNAKLGDTLYNHSFKNAWIDEHVDRFIDVPFAVGANADGTWYSQLAETGGIHPSWRGAEAIAYQFVADVPELTFINL